MSLARATYRQEVEYPQGNYGDPDERTKSVSKKDEGNGDGGLQEYRTYRRAADRVEHPESPRELAGAGSGVDDTSRGEERS